MSGGLREARAKPRPCAACRARRAVGALAHAPCWRGRRQSPPRRREHVRGGGPRVLQRARPRALPSLSPRVSRLELDQGLWSEAADSASSVLRIPRTSTTPRIVSLVVLGLPRARRGDPEAWLPLDE